MVIQGHEEQSRIDRGQLVLIGALTLAFILLGVVVVFNGVQYTETVSSGEAGESTEDVRMTEAELERGVENALEYYDSENLNEGEVAEDLEEYINDIYAEKRAHERTVSITASIDENDLGITIVGTTITFEEFEVSYTYESNAVQVKGTISIPETEVTIEE